MIALRMASGHTAHVENHSALSILRPVSKHLTAHQKGAFGIHIHDRVPGFSRAQVKGAITNRSRADASDVEKRMNRAEPPDAGRDGIANRRLVAHVGNCEIRFAKLRCQQLALVSIYSDDKHWVFCRPHARGGSGNPRRSGDEQDFLHSAYSNRCLRLLRYAS